MIRRASSVLVLIAVAALLSAQTVPDLVAEGQSMLVRGDYLDAIDAFRRALRLNPNDIDANVGLADAYFTIDEIDQAQQQIAIALRLARGNGDVVVLAGRIAVAAGDVEGADALFAQVLANEPNNIDAAIARAELALAQGRSSAARTSLERSLRIRPDHRRALLSLALVYEYQGDIDIASDYMQLAQRVHRDRTDVHLVAAQYYSRVGDIDRAASAARTARSLDPNALTAARILAGIALEEGNALQAISLAEQLIVADRTDHNAWFLRAAGLRASGRPDEAMTSIRTALSIAPDEELYRIYAEELALSVLEIDDPVRAELSGARGDEAQALATGYRFATAERRYQRALLLSPLDAALRQSYADLFLDSGYVASHLQELSVALDGTLPTDTDVLQETISADLAASWGVDQFTIDRIRPTIGLYAPAADAFPWSATVPATLTYIGSALRSTDAIDVANLAIVADRADAFATARSQDVDFFVLVGLDAGGGSIELTAELLVTRTGVVTDRITAVRSGPGYVSAAIDGLVDDVVARLPRLARVVARRGDVVLIDRGERDAIAADDAWTLLPAGTLVTSPDSSEYLFAEADIRGEAVSGDADDLISEATITIRGLVDRVRIGDILIETPTEDSAEEEESIAAELERSDLGLLLYQRIRRLR